MRLGLACLILFLVAVLLPLTAPAQKPHSFKLEPLSPKFEDLIASDAKLETVATGFGFTEGPMWDPAGFLYVSDETINKIFRVHSMSWPQGRGHCVGRSGRQHRYTVATQP